MHINKCSLIFESHQLKSFLCFLIEQETYYGNNDKTREKNHCRYLELDKEPLIFAWMTVLFFSVSCGCFVDSAKHKMQLPPDLQQGRACSCLIWQCFFVRHMSPVHTTSIPWKYNLCSGAMPGKKPLQLNNRIIFMLDLMYSSSFI